jgi:protein ImuB
MISNLQEPETSRQGELLAQRRYLALTLPFWAADCCRRHEPALAGAGRPLVFYEKQGSALRLVAMDRMAEECGLTRGQSLGDARALVPDLVAREIDHDRLATLFADFADWHSYASPIVAVMADRAPYGDLVLDITGVSHLFGGEEAMLQRVTARLAELGFTAGGAIAATVGAAWALAHYRPGTVLAGSETEALFAALSGLPVAALRLDAEQVAGLNRLGLKRIGQLYGRNRKAMAARFGHGLVERLDQALGLTGETLRPRLPPVEHFAERRFADPVGLLDDVLMTGHDLAVRLCLQLQEAELGARAFHLFLYRVDHRVTTFTVNAARATRDAAHVARLFAHRAERLTGEFDPGFGIDMIRLAAGDLCRLDAAQIGAFEQGYGAEDLDRLHDRLASRLGPGAVLRLAFVNTHIPERAERLVPAGETAADPDVGAEPDPERRRPLRLLPQPERIEVARAEVPDGPPAGMVWRHVSYRFVRVSSPERIAAEWWREDFLLSTRSFRPPTPAEIAERKSREPIEVVERHPIPARDYFIVEDEAGHRFWLFRQGFYTPTTMPAWFLHGVFA